MSIRFIILAVACITINVCIGQVRHSGQDSAAISWEYIILPEKPKAEKLHTVMLSFGKTIPVNSSANYLLYEAVHIKLFKNVYAGIKFESSIDRIWEHKHELTADTISGFSAELSVMAFSNPLYRKGKSSIGLWGDIGAGIFSSYRYLGLPGGFNYYDSFSEKQYYMRLTGGMYYKYRGFFLTLGLFVNDLKLEEYDGHRMTGIFRKPTTYGLELAVRFAMW